jgi:hypothetical protein
MPTPGSSVRLQYFAASGDVHGAKKYSSTLEGSLMQSASPLAWWMATSLPSPRRPLRRGGLSSILARVAERWSRLRRTPAPRFRRGIPRRGDVYSEYFNLLLKAVGELEARSYCAPVDVYMADSSSWMPSRVCGVVVSPPFANNIDYVRHTMLELLWSGIARDSRDLGWVRSLQVPACEAASRSWKPHSTHPWLMELASRIKGSRARGFRRFLLAVLPRNGAALHPTR